MTAAEIVRDATATGSDVVGGLRLDWSVACNVGRVREANEDAALVMPGRFLLADGMGGHESGELASEAALLALADTPVYEHQDATRDEVEELLRAAQRAISDIDSETARRAGTTATGAVLVTYEDKPHWLVFNIGDSRTYCSRGGLLEQVTIDHSQVQEFVDAGFMTAAQARVDPRRNVITRALGAGMVEPQADFFAFETEPGDKLLICSDGLTGELPDPELAELLNAADTPQAATESLVDAALALGAHDNVTVIVVSVAADEESGDQASEAGSADADVDVVEQNDADDANGDDAGAGDVDAGDSDAGSGAGDDAGDSEAGDAEGSDSEGGDAEGDEHDDADTEADPTERADTVGDSAAGDTATAPAPSGDGKAAADGGSYER